MADLDLHTAVSHATETFEGLSDNVGAALVVGPAVLGCVWALKEYLWIRSIEVNGIAQASLSSPLKSAGCLSESTVHTMNEIAGHIDAGATAFLVKEYQYMAWYIVVFSAIIGPFISLPTMIAFIIGSVTSILCGYIGMKVAVFTNVRTTHESWKTLRAGFETACRGGSVMGFSLVSIGVLTLYALIYYFTHSNMFENQTQLFEALAGYGLGGSSIALFGRVGGGIYTKAADVGADLSGKNEYGMDEDDPRNPACIADNVGDNVGDIAGMGADLFGSFAESTCAALVISASADCTLNKYGLTAMLYPVVLSSSGIVVGLLTMIIIGMTYKVDEVEQIEKALKAILTYSTVLMTPVAVALSYYLLPPSFVVDADHQNVTRMACLVPVLLGLWSGLAIGFMTEYYTSHSYTPVREIANSQKIAAATGIIYGLALGYMSCVVPIICLAVTICVSHILAGMYGVALAALGMLGTLTMGLTIDAYGPISDNAGGIAEMSELGPEVRRRTDALDAAGNTTAAIGKGFAIGSAALVSLALFGAFCVRAEVTDVDILDPWVFSGLLYGAMMPYWFSAMTMKSVGQAANDMVAECMAQFPKIISGEMKPDYHRCISISTEASLKEMIAPGVLVIGSPLIAGVCFGRNCTAGLLAGSLVSGVQLAISMSNTGGAWDNAKKYIESGGLGVEFGKGSSAHKAAVTGDTVGDPLKDTSGPSLNILVKLSAIMSLVFGTVIKNFSNERGGPIWLKA